MKRLTFCFLTICFLVMATSLTRVLHVKAINGSSPQLSESVRVDVNCTTATVATVSMVSSSNTSLVHFPSGVDMNNEGLMNVTTIVVTFSTAQSYLIYVFNNTDTTTARSIADGTTTSISTAFSTSFAWFSTNTSDGSVNVTYTGAGKTNLTQYVEGLMTQCLAPDLGGFSLTFLQMTHEPGAYTGVAAIKDIGSFAWAYSMMTGYMTSIATGSGNHLVDILDLLDVSSLAPSAYAVEIEIGYASQVTLTISSDSAVSYVSSQPGTANPPARGWFLFPYPPPNTLIALFRFGLSPSPQSPLTLTFSGVVIPEFTTTALLLLFLLSAMTALVARKRFSRLQG